MSAHVFSSSTLAPSAICNIYSYNATSYFAPSKDSAITLCRPRAPDWLAVHRNHNAEETTCACRSSRFLAKSHPQSVHY